MNRPGAEHEREEGLVTHLVELRARLVRAVLAVMLVFIALLPFAQRIYAQFAQPLLQQLPAGGQIIAIDVASPFFAPIKLAFFAALVIAMPVVLYQLWAFVAPGLYRHEKKLAVPLLVSAVALFYLGVVFAWFAVLPLVFAFLTAVTPEGVAMMTDITRYLDFVLLMFMAFGLSFELPVAVVIMAALGWVDIDQLRAARPYVIVGIFVLAAIITPPDAVSQIMLGVPMCLLYELGIIAARMVVRGNADATT
ncbi:twin-arginine translocase subunit TatC [Alkalisalibacterium limincola]|uniref:Sec-independent protein translocase protein TatC n=1 Tax=Alkalisalibacterium limincola TaxID=2699169 RepID=A0A5C8KQX8_9GAMM|nr:twin-arginine translocase subunit TatC [Alkalisalibacterium limincola]TXK62236.1 twin-arginine translocase subunit TatC [Alkalisalibacterium limincola]